MAKDDVFEKKFSDTMAQDNKAILEELNLPPALIEFIRKNSNTIKIAVVVLIVGVVAWEGYGKYVTNQQEKSSAMLYAAIESEDADGKKSQLEALAEKYSGSAGSGVWGNVELGHLAFEQEDYAKAAEYYSIAKKQIKKSNPLYPLIQFSVAQVYENMGEIAKAKEAFAEMVKIVGFEGEGYLGLARIAEAEGSNESAISYYQEYLNLPSTQPGQTKDWVENKMSTLKK